MKIQYFSTYLSYFFILILINATVYPEGFVSGTLVHTPTKLVPIEQLDPGDHVTSAYDLSQPKTYSVINTHTFTTNTYVMIGIQDTYICTEPNQRFYSITQQNWVTANALTPHDTLLCCNNMSVQISTLQQVQQSVKMYALSVNESHVYCVSPFAIITHNFEPASLAATATLSIACPPAAPIIMGAQAIFTGIMAGFGCYVAYKKYRQKKKTFSPIDKKSKNNNCHNNNSPKKPKDDEHDGYQKRKQNTITKTAFFKKIKDQYRHYKEDKYRRKPGATGLDKKAEYIKWDHLHNDVEAYDKSGRHLGSYDPETLRCYKPADPTNTIDLS